MEKDNIHIFIVFIITISILITGCSTNYIGHYYNKSNSMTYNSEIEINHDYLIYKASSDMLGTVIQKEKYQFNKDSITVEFKTDNLINSSLVSSFDGEINGIKIILLPILTNDSSTPVVNVTVNDTIEYMPRNNDTILNIKKLKKIAFKDVGLHFIKDTIIYFPNEKNNVVKIKLTSTNEIPVLNQKGTIKYLINGKKLYLLNYDKSIKKYVRNKIYYLKR